MRFPNVRSAGSDGGNTLTITRGRGSTSGSTNKKKTDQSRWFKKHGKAKKMNETVHKKNDTSRRRERGNKTDTSHHTKKKSMIYDDSRYHYDANHYDTNDYKESYRYNTPPDPETSSHTITNLSSLLMRPPPLKDESSESLLAQFLLSIAENSERQPPSPSPPAVSPSLYSSFSQRKKPSHAHSNYNNYYHGTNSRIRQPENQIQTESKLLPQSAQRPQPQKITKTKTARTTTSTITSVSLNTNEERQSKFDALEFTWKLINHANWYVRYEELEKYKQRHGNIYVPLHYPDNPMLGRWVYKQKELYRRHKEEQIAALKQNDGDGMNRKSVGRSRSASSINSSRRRGILKDRGNLNHHKQTSLTFNTRSDGEETMKGKGSKKEKFTSVGELTYEKALALERLGFEYNGVNVF